MIKLDKRKQRIFLTNKAKEFRKKYDKPINEGMNELFNNIDKNELKITIKVISMLSNSIEKIRSERNE